MRRTIRCDPVSVFRGEMASMVYNWEHDEVDAVVVTDGSR